MSIIKTQERMKNIKRKHRMYCSVEIDSGTGRVKHRE